MDSPPTVYPDYYLLPIPIILIFSYILPIMQNWKAFLAFCTVAFVLWGITWYAMYQYSPPSSGEQWLSPNEFGDMFGCLACLFTGFGCAGLIITLLQQNSIISETKEQTHINFFYQTLNLYIAECDKWNHQKNGFIFSCIPPEYKSEYIPFINPKNTECKKDEAFYHDIRVEASLYLSLLNYVSQMKNAASKEAMRSILLHLLTVNKQRTYFAYLHITKNFPNLRKIKLDLMNEGYFAPDTTVSTAFLETWGANLYEKLSKANQTTNI